MPAISFSRTCVTRLSMISAEAPRYRVSTETTGGLMSGYSRSASWSSASTPTITSTRLMTAAKTGRRTEVSEMIIGPDLAAGQRRDRHAGADLLGTLCDYGVTLFEAVHDLDHTWHPSADADLPLHGLFFLYQEHVLTPVTRR